MPRAAALVLPLLAASAAAVTIQGRVEWPPGYPHAADATLTLTPADPTQPPIVTWATPAGDFVLAAAPAAAAAALDVSAPGLVFPRVLLRTGGDEAGDGGGAIAAAWYADAPEVGPLPTSPLTLRPAARAVHFDEAPPFNLVAFLRTPYGMLIAFVAFAVFALPRMKIDPDELEELMGSRGGGAEAGAGGAGAADAPRAAPALAGGAPPPATGAQRRRAAAS